MRKFIFAFLLLAGCATTPQKEKFLVLVTDFGLKDGAVSAMKGVAYSAAPSLIISDLTHEVPPFNIWEASYRIQQTYNYWPKGTVFVTVVDPGVGSERKPIVAQTKSGYYFVGPDNGHLTLLQEDVARSREIDMKKNLRPGSEQSYTFHGRDLFVLVGARLAAGQLNFEDVGPEHGPLKLLPNAKAEVVNGVLSGQIPVLDPNYGNVWTNIPKKFFLDTYPTAKNFEVKILNKGKAVFSGRVPLTDTFAGVALGQPLLYFNSLLNLAVAVNQGNFAQKHKIGSGPDWTIQIKAAK